jgi:hypothetical protein
MTREIFELYCNTEFVAVHEETSNSQETVET